jgi:hypothetical protein
MSAQSPLKDRIDQLQAQADAASQIFDAITQIQADLGKCRDIVATYPELAADLAAELRAIADSIHTPSVGGQRPSAATSSRGPMEKWPGHTLTAFEMLKDFFQQRGNEPATIGEMIAAARAAAPTVRQLLYRRKRSAFRKVVMPGTNEVKYCLWQPGDEPTEATEDIFGSVNSPE